ncbi:MAG: hypothetical protein Q8861_07535 [Bacteroidota bacterium]|nr:hypothetical protein [Bacteroidota bacterium]
MTKYGKIAIVSIVLLFLIPLSYQGRKKYFRDKRAHYAIGITTGTYAASRASTNIYFNFISRNKKIECEDIYDHSSGAKRKNGRYFVRFDSLHPSNAVLLQDFPVPDSIKIAPPNGWKEIPVKRKDN